MRRKSTYRRNQRGVALLFALGVLSLLLVMGLAFVANSLLAQKVASNNSSRSQAKMLAQSAINRIATSVLYYQYTATEKSVIPCSYMDIFSCYDLPKYKQLIGYKPKYFDAESSDEEEYFAAKDGLRTADSKLMPPGWLKHDDWEKELRGQWSYITTEAKNPDDKSSDYLEGDKVKLIGRVAFQTFPTAGTAQINLDHVLRGAYEEQVEPKREPWKIRIGEDINELNLNGALASSEPFTSEPSDSWSDKKPPQYDNMHTGTFDAFFQAYWNNLLFNSDSHRQEMQDWIHRWFSEGTVAADPEHYVYSSTSGTKYYHRFNLGKLVNDEEETIADEWYDRLVGDAKITAAEYNTEKAIEALAYGGENSAEFKITDRTTPREVDRKVGLPFLKLIGSSKGSFDNIADRRRQIAANLNDYCDGDSIPTSNVKAEEWKDKLTPTANPDTDWPKYTGNEKTPYINELAFGFKVEPSLKKGAGAFASSDVIVNLKVNRAELIAELIKIYKDLINKDGVENNNDYELRTYLKSLKLKFKVTAKGILTYTSAGGSAATKVSLANGTSEEKEIEYAGQEVILAFKDTATPDNSPVWDNGYLVYARELDASLSSPSPKNEGIDFDFSTKFPSYSGTVTSATLDEVKIEVTSAKFQLGGVALIDTHDYGSSSGSPSSSFGVDFVRWEDDRAEENLLGTDTALALFSKVDDTLKGPSKGEWIAGSSLGSIPEGYRYFYLGGMEAKDPRQNLNAKYTAIVPQKEETDWSQPDRIKLVDFDNASEVMSIKMADKPEEVTGDKVKDRLVAGKCNHDSSPKRTLSGDVLDDECDAEFSKLTEGDPNLDPAWRGDGENEHLSTAYIRNAPMRSPWELGVIHRAMAWQTLNLKSAIGPVSKVDTAIEAEVPDDAKPISSENMNPNLSWDEATGTSFAGGDGGILEQIKMTDNAYCYGKLNVNMLSNDKALNPDYTEKDDDMARALFFNIERNQSIGDLFVDDSGSYSETGTPIDWKATETVREPIKKAVEEFRAKYGAGYEHAFENRAQFLAWKDSDGKCLANGFGIFEILGVDYEKLPDAQREEIVGKTINLLKGANSVSNMIRFVVVAQTIRDMKGPIARIKYDGSVKLKEGDCHYGVFDVGKDESVPSEWPKNEQFLYFDEITGEVKLLVTMENNPTTGQIIVRQIEYLE